MTEIFSYTACRQLSQMFSAVFFFHVSEYFLAAVIHGKSSVNLTDLGLVLVVTGEILRKMAIITAGQSFTHIIRVRPDERHQLVTHVVVWKFFSSRIPYEEYFLRQFFGMQYVEYAEQVVSGVPFVN
ncbi:protein-S-isoprenylcysteine O-methyltransferase A [Trifolium repens]|nr:protein-S-isoprenylcysteine O-methyltransferase A [Trifolium repens]